MLTAQQLGDVVPSQLLGGEDLHTWLPWAPLKHLAALHVPQKHSFWSVALLYRHLQPPAAWHTPSWLQHVPLTPPQRAAGRLWRRQGRVGLDALALCLPAVCALCV